MALHNPPSLYTGGAERLNSQQGVNLYAQLMARKQSKMDALDAYYSKAIRDTTPAGMRNKDVVEGWSKKFNDWQSLWMNPEKRKYIRNPKLDDFKTLTLFNSMHQDLLADANSSKQELADEKMLNQLRIAGKWNPTDGDMEIAHRKGLSIYDPQRRDEMGNDVDLTQLSYNIPEFTPLQEQQLYKSSSQGFTKSKRYDEKNTRKDGEGTEFIPFEEKHSPEQIKVIADNYGNGLTKSALVHYENLMHNSETYSTATKAYQQIYGEDQIIDTPQKMAKAIGAIHAMGETKTGEEKTPDWMLRTRINQANKERNIALNKTANPDEVYDIYKTVKDDIAKRQAQGQQWLEVIQLSNPNAVKNIVEQAQIKKKSLTPDKLRIIEGDDGSIRIFTKPDANGKTDFVGYVDKTAMNVPKQPTAKQKTAVIVEGNPPIKKPKPMDRLGIRD